MPISKRKKSPSLRALSSFVHDQQKKIHMINEYVQQNIDDEKILSDLLMLEQQRSTIGQRVADKVASFGGSWWFIGSFILFMAMWMILNLVFRQYAWDEYPFVLLNLCLSTTAALQAPIILMSQNRHAQIEAKKAEHDYMINLKAELQIKHLHDKIDLIIVEEMKKLFAVQAQQLNILKGIEKYYKKEIVGQRTKK